MFKSFYKIIAVFTIFLAFYSCADKKSHNRTLNKKHNIWLSGEKTDLVQDPSIVQGRLNNGFRYFILKNKTPKDRVSINLVVEAGSMHEKEDQRGLAHFLEHMVFNGSEHFKPGELVRYFQKLGMNFGGDANAHTGFYHTVYDIVLPKGDKKSLEEGFLVLHDYANSALLLKKEIEKERGIILSEKRDRYSASYKTFEKVLNFEMKGSLVPDRLPIGTEKVIKNAGRDLIKDYYDTWYRPQKMSIFIAGDLDVKTAEKMIRDKFSSLKARAEERKDPDTGDIKHLGIKPFYYYNSESASTSVKIEILYNKETDTDSFDNQKKILIDYIGDTIVQNRIKAVTGKKETDFISAYISSGSFLKRYGYASLSAKSKPENWRNTLSSIEKILRTANTFGFTQNEYDRVKKDIESYYINKVKSSHTRDSLSLTREMVNSFQDGYVMQSPSQELKVYREIIKDIDLNDISEAFKKKWDKDHRLVIVTGNAKISENASDAEKEILTVFNSSKGVKVEPPVLKDDAAFPYLDDPVKKGEIVKKEYIKDLGIHKIIFKNGSVLNLKKTDYKENEVLFNVIFGHGKKLEPSDMRGISDLSVSVVNQSGFGKIDRDQLERALTGKNTSVALSVDNSYFKLSGKSVTSELNLMFRLLYTYFTDMGFREDALDYVKNKYQQQYQSMKKTVEGVTELESERFFASGDHRFEKTEIERLNQYSLEDIRNYMIMVMKETPVEISIVGDFDIDHAVLLASRFIGTLPDADKFSSENSEKIKFPSGKKQEERVKTTINKGQVIIAYPTEDFWNIKRTRRLGVLGTVYSNRLHEIIREKKAVAYSPYAYNFSSTAFKDFGYLKIVIGIDPSQKDFVLREVSKISEDLRKKGVNSDELKRALDPILTSIKDYRKKNIYWLRSVLTGSSRYPQKFEWSRTFHSDYKNIKSEEISRLASKYLKNRKKAVFSVLPEKGKE